MLLRIRQRLSASSTMIGLSVFLAVIVLALTITLAASMLTQSRDLDRNVEVTSDIINANVRTLGQLQRELLRMSVKLQHEMTTTEDLELQQAFVSQRVNEAQLSYQLQTLGTEELLAEARRIADEWHNELSPEVTEIIEARAAGQVVDIQPILEKIGDAELHVNQLVAQGEINRRNQAGQANDVTLGLLHNARRLVVGLLATFAGGLALLIIAMLSYRTFARQRRASQAELAAVHAEAQTLSEVASRTSNTVVITCADGCIEWVNDAFVETTGYQLSEVLGQRPGRLLQGPDTAPETVAFMRRQIAAGEGFTTEVLNYTRNNKPYWTAIEVRPVHDAAGVLTNFIAVQSDITAARKQEASLVQAKNAAVELAEHKAQFLASMSHEIRTPLNAVIGLTDLLLDSDLQPQQREYVQIAHNSGTLVLSTISNILSYSATDSGNVELEARPFSLRQIAERTVAILDTQAKDKGLELHVSVADDVPEAVVGDKVRLQQVLMNLVGNAVKFTEHGRVDLAVHMTGSHQPDSDTQRFEIEVRDTGIGIAEELLGRLFQPFSQVDPSITRRYGGSGLGLAISQQLVELMGGNINVSSTPGQGSRFSIAVELPIAKPSSADTTDSTVVRPDAETAGLNVLLVEDDEINQTVARHMLDRLGHTVTVANDGIEAVAAVESTDFDVVLMDIQMPRMDGLTATDEIRTRLPSHRQPRIIALTANALDGDRERFLAAGLDEYLSKPFRRDQLAETIRRVTDGVVHA